MALSLTGASKILKVFYLPQMQKVFNTQTILWDRLERGTKWNPEGKNFTLGINFGRHAQAGSGRTGSGATLPAAAEMKYENAIVPAAYLYTRIEIEGPVIKAARSNAGSFVRAVRSQVEGATESTKKSLNRQANGDGRDWLGFYRTGTGTAAGTMDDGGPSHGRVAGGPNPHANVFFQPGVLTLADLIDATDNATVLDSNYSITVGAENATDFSYAVTAGGNIDAVAATGEDYYVLAGTLGFQMTGLRAIISNVDPVLLAGGLHGLTVAAAPWWVGQVVGSYQTASLQDLRFPLLNRVISRVSQNSPNGKEDIKFILTSYRGQDAYYDLASNERIAVNTMVLDGGFEGVEFSGIPIVADPEHSDGEFDFIVPDALKILTVGGEIMEWMEEDGNMLSRVANKDSYEATLFGYVNLGTPRRNSLGALIGINV